MGIVGHISHFPWSFSEWSKILDCSSGSFLDCVGGSEHNSVQYNLSNKQGASVSVNVQVKAVYSEDLQTLSQHLIACSNTGNSTSPSQHAPSYKTKKNYPFLQTLFETSRGLLLFPSTYRTGPHLLKVLDSPCLQKSAIDINFFVRLKINNLNLYPYT